MNNLPSTRRRWRATATTTIARPPDQVWEFIRPAETRSVTWPPSRQTFRLEPAPGGTTLTYTTEVSGARWWQPRTLVHRAVVAGAQRYVDAVKRVMESEPPVSGSPPAAVPVPTDDDN